LPSRFNLAGRGRGIVISSDEYHALASQLNQKCLDGVQFDEAKSLKLLWSRGAFGQRHLRAAPAHASRWVHLR
jgi:hypothetical protein